MAIYQYPSNYLHLNEDRYAPLHNIKREKYLARTARFGSGKAQRKARNELVLRNLRYVFQQAAIRSNFGTLQDLFEEGILGLYHSFDKYDLTFCQDERDRFMTYTKLWVQEYMNRWMQKNEKGSVRLSIRKQEMYNLFGRISRDYQQETGKSPSDEEIADIANRTNGRKYTQRQVQEVNQHHEAVQAVSLDEVLKESDSCLYSLVEDKTVPSPESMASHSFFTRSVARILKNEDPRYMDIVERIYGLNGYEPQTLTETGETLGLSYEWVRILKLKALNVLKEELSTLGFK